MVNVVVIDLRDGAGDENVLSRSPSVRGTVALVPAPEIVVSAVVPRVGALDFAGSSPSCEKLIDTFCLELELCRESEDDNGMPNDWLWAISDRAVEEYGPGVLLTIPIPSFLPDCLSPAVSLCMFLRFAKRFIQVANGLLRACRSGLKLAERSLNEMSRNGYHVRELAFRWRP